ncbi:putative reverse transcriptase domain-containing protein [Tanacetum coccineum]
MGHLARDCIVKTLATGSNTQQIVTCFGCEEKGHYKNKCPKKKDQPTEDARGRAYMMRTEEPQQNPNAVTETNYEVELADGKVVSTSTILCGCTLNLLNHLFKIDLLPIELGSFDVVIGMDWLSEHCAVTVCGDKIVRIPYNNKMLAIEGDIGKSRLSVISCIKA